MTYSERKALAATIIADPTSRFNRLRAEGFTFAANIALADIVGTWVAYDARKEAGLV